MTETGPLTRDVIEFEIDGVSLRVAAMHREGERPPVVFLHGFGSTKEDYADAAFYPQFDGRRLIAFDAPGCGETGCADLSALSIPFLQQTAEEVLRHFGVERFHLVGHSMGGLTALMLAGDNRDSVLSFANIEGNVAPEDCFLSRQVLEYPADNPEEFLKAFGERAWSTASFSSPLYAAALHHKVRAEAVAPIFRSMVALSDNEESDVEIYGVAVSENVRLWRAEPFPFLSRNVGRARRATGRDRTFRSLAHVLQCSATLDAAGCFLRPGRNRTLGGIEPLLSFTRPIGRSRRINL